MNSPQHGGGDDLDITTALYLDIFIALECFGMRYPVYMAVTSPEERMLYQMYLSLKGLKEEHIHKRMQREAEIEREMSQPGGPPVRR